MGLHSLREADVASSVIDSMLFRNMFGTADMRAIFSDEALVGRYLEAAEPAQQLAACGCQQSRGLAHQPIIAMLASWPEAG